jgi:hypothetical protein
MFFWSLRLSQIVLNLLNLQDKSFLFFSLRYEGSTNPSLKRLLIWVFERHPTLLFFLGWVRLQIFEIFKSLILKEGQGLTFEKC